MNEVARALNDVSAAEPSRELARPLQALWWLKKGGLKMGQEWQMAHALCQQDEGDPAHDVVHALAHWIEGDVDNAAYWYRRCGGKREATLEAEWMRIARLLSLGA